MSCFEVLFTSESSGQLWNTCVWDPASTTSLVSYKGSNSGPRTMCLIAGDYLISAAYNKPLIHVWALHRQEQMQLKIVSPGRVNAMAVSPDGQYCIAAVAEKIHIWQVCTGVLLAVLTHHYQPVNVLRFSDDGSHFVSGGEDNLVLVWFLSRLVKQSNTTLGLATSAVNTPRHTWSSHSLPVTDVHVGRGGVRARVATASLDHTVKLWEMGSGQMLANFVFEASITSVAMDNAEVSLFCGNSIGHIYSVNLFEKPVRVERHVTEPEGNMFRGHSKQVSCLAVSLDGSTLASGSHDATVKLWDIPSKQCTKSISHKGPVTNVLLVPRPVGLEVTADTKSRSASIRPINTFQRHLQESTSGEGENSTRNYVSIRLGGFTVEEDMTGGCVSSRNESVSTNSNGSDEKSITDLQKQVEELKVINRQLYDYSVKNILKTN